MTQEQLREMIGETVEEKLIELLGDPDAGLAVRKSLRARLLRQRRKVVQGDRGDSLDAVARKLGLQ
jgi:hypothetical protein